MAGDPSGMTQSEEPILSGIYAMMAHARGGIEVSAATASDWPRSWGIATARKSLLLLGQCGRRLFATLTRRRLHRGVFRSLVNSQAATNRYLGQPNRKPRPFIWTADKVMASKSLANPSTRFREKCH